MFKGRTTWAFYSFILEIIWDRGGEAVFENEELI